MGVGAGGRGPQAAPSTAGQQRSLALAAPPFGFLLDCCIMQGLPLQHPTASRTCGKQAGSSTRRAQHALACGWASMPLRVPRPSVRNAATPLLLQGAEHAQGAGPRAGRPDGGAGAERAQGHLAGGLHPRHPGAAWPGHGQQGQGDALTCKARARIASVHALLAFAHSFQPGRPPSTPTFIQQHAASPLSPAVPHCSTLHRRPARRPCLAPQVRTVPEDPQVDSEDESSDGERSAAVLARRAGSRDAGHHA